MTRRDDRAVNRDTNWGLWAIGGLLAIGAVILVILLIGGNEGPEAGVTTDDITDDDGQAFVGRQVTVSEAINEIIGPNAFTIGGGDFFGGENLLVVGSEGAFPVPLAVDPADAEGLADDEVLETDDVVQVTGTVRMFVIAEIEDEIGVDLDDELFTEFEDQAVIVAETVDLTPEQEPANEPAADATIDEIVNQPEVYIGDSLTVSGEVNQFIGANAFELGGEDFLEGEGLLVVGSDETISNFESEFEGSEQELAAQVQGTVQVFNIADIEEELGVDLDDGLFEEFEGEPVVVASSIQAVPLGG